MKHALMIAALMSALGMGGCAYKGKLKSPAQIEYDQQKKERQAAKEAARDEKNRQRQLEMEQEQE